jgi:hypothetical protein
MRSRPRGWRRPLRSARTGPRPRRAAARQAVGGVAADQAKTLPRRMRCPRSAQRLAARPQRRRRPARHPPGRPSTPRSTALSAPRAPRGRRYARHHRQVTAADRPTGRAVQAPRISQRAPRPRPRRRGSRKPRRPEKSRGRTAADHHSAFSAVSSSSEPCVHPRVVSARTARKSSVADEWEAARAGAEFLLSLRTGRSNCPVHDGTSGTADGVHDSPPYTVAHGRRLAHAVKTRMGRSLDAGHRPREDRLPTAAAD